MSPSDYIRANKPDDYIFPPIMPKFRPSTIGPLQDILTDGKTWFALGKYARYTSFTRERCGQDIRADAKDWELSERAKALEKMIEDTSPPAYSRFRKPAGKIEQGPMKRGIEKQTASKGNPISGLGQSSLPNGPVEKPYFRFIRSLDELKKREADGSLFGAVPTTMKSDKPQAVNEATNLQYQSPETLSSAPSLFSNIKANHTQNPPRNDRNIFILYKDNDDISTLDLNRSRARTPPEHRQPTLISSPDSLFQKNLSILGSDQMSRSESLSQWADKLKIRELDLLRREGIQAQRETALALKELKMEIRGMGQRIGDGADDSLRARRDKAAKEADAGPSGDDVPAPNLEWLVGVWR